MLLINMQILQLVSVVVLLMLSSSITANAQRSACKVEYTKVICPMATLYYSVGEYNGKTVFCGRLEVTNGGVGWIALGVSSLGGAQAMGGSGSVAIIGNPINGSVTVYDLYGIPSNGIVGIEKSAIAILESSTKVTGTKTIMEFTKYEQQQQQQLNNNDNDYASFANPTNYILHARGMSNTMDIMVIHAFRSRLIYPQAVQRRRRRRRQQQQQQPPPQQHLRLRQLLPQQ